MAFFALWVKDKFLDIENTVIQSVLGNLPSILCRGWNSPSAHLWVLSRIYWKLIIAIKITCLDTFYPLRCHLTFKIQNAQCASCPKLVNRLFQVCLEFRICNTFSYKNNVASCVWISQDSPKGKSYLIYKLICGFWSYSLIFINSYFVYTNVCMKACKYTMWLVRSTLFCRGPGFIS